MYSPQYQVVPSFAVANQSSVASVTEPSVRTVSLTVMQRTPPGGYPEMDVYSLMLTTTGRKSGEKFVFPLYYGTTGDSYIIVASKGGAPDHPGWYKNLVANPDVEVQVGTKKLRAKARTVTGEERAKPRSLRFLTSSSAPLTVEEWRRFVIDPVGG